MINWLKKLMLFRLMILVFQFKKLTKTQKLKIWKRKFLIIIYILLLMILRNFQVLYLMKGLKQTKLATIIDLNNVKQRAIKNEQKQKNYKHLI